MLEQANVPGTIDEHPNWRRKLPHATWTRFQNTALFQDIARAVSQERPRPAMIIPSATYRLQFRNGMTFERAGKLAPYLARLGISHLYASPIFQAEPGSTHGYDVVDNRVIDPSLGGDEGFERMSRRIARGRDRAHSRFRPQPHERVHVQSLLARRAGVGRGQRLRAILRHRLVGAEAARSGVGNELRPGARSGKVRPPFRYRRRGPDLHLRRPQAAR